MATTFRDYPSPPVILIIDDVVQNIEIVGVMLRDQGVRVIGATSAEQGFRIMASKAPDLILLDVQMPDMDGFEACKILKSQSFTQSIPVIFLTAKTETEDVLRGFQLGAVDYITKPFQPSELLARVKAHIELKYLRDRMVQHNSELQETNAQLTQLNQEKNEFLSIAAHDLKNPLTNVIMSAEILEQFFPTMQPGEVKQRVQHIRTAAVYMRSIVSNLLDIHVLETGQLYLAQVQFELIPSLNSIVHAHKQQVEHKHQTITINNTTGSLVHIYADPVKTTEVLENLLSNAIKYSPAATTISITVSIHGTTARVAIQDQGPGLSRPDQELLFTKFSRLSSKPTGGEHSTGLGLYIVKKLMDAMNGRVWCESTLGSGATFFVEFPLLQAAQDTTS